MTLGRTRQHLRRAWQRLFSEPDPRVWLFRCNVSSAFTEEVCRARGFSVRPEAMQVHLDIVKIEEYPTRARVHTWCTGTSRAAAAYYWIDFDFAADFATDSVPGDLLEVAEAPAPWVGHQFWSLKLTEDLLGCEYSLQLFREAVSPRALLLRFSVNDWDPHRRDWRREPMQRTDLVFKVPLDPDLLWKRTGTGQEHQRKKLNGWPNALWYGRSDEEPWTWEWSLDVSYWGATDSRRKI